jgi:hypothetical protein
LCCTSRPLACCRKCAANRAQHSAASKLVDESVKSGLADKAAPKDAVAKLKEFDGIWKDFKKTRDGEIIPAVKAGKVDAAKALAKGIQAERMGKLKELLAALGAK